MTQKQADKLAKIIAASLLWHDDGCFVGATQFLSQEDGERLNEGLIKLIDQLRGDYPTYGDTQHAIEDFKRNELKKK